MTTLPIYTSFPPIPLRNPNIAKFVNLPLRNLGRAKLLSLAIILSMVGISLPARWSSGSYVDGSATTLAKINSFPGLLLMILSSTWSGFSTCQTRNCVLSSLCFFRFQLSLWIGCDYLVSATILEFTKQKTRRSFVAVIFSTQGFRILVSSIITMIITVAFDHGSSPSSNNQPPDEVDLAWRSILMFGAFAEGFLSLNL